MKAFLFLSGLIFCQMIYASAFMSQVEQDDYLNIIAKQIRKELHMAGYENISTGISSITKQKLDEYLSPEYTESYESNLDQDEIEKLYACINESSCNLYLISASSEYYSGTGIQSHFVALDIANRTHEIFRHSVYSE